MASSSSSDEKANGYKLPPKDIRDIIDALVVPTISISPRRDKLIFLNRSSTVPLKDVAKPKKILGIPIDPRNHSRSQISSYTRTGIQSLNDNESVNPPRNMSYFTGIRIKSLKFDEGRKEDVKEVTELPNRAKIYLVKWSPDGQHLAFVVKEENDDGKLRLWYVNVESGEAKQLFQSQPEIYVNAVFDDFEWLNESKLLVCTVAQSQEEPPKRPQVPNRPTIKSHEPAAHKDLLKEVPSLPSAGTNQDLPQDEYDEQLIYYYGKSQLVVASLDGSNSDIGEPGIYTGIIPSPDGKYILIESIYQPESSSEVEPSVRNHKKVEVWKDDGTIIKTLRDLPLAHDIPLNPDGTRNGKRRIQWRIDKPSTVCWVESQYGEDLQVPRDIIYTQRADAPENEKPTILYRLDLRFSGIQWCDNKLALVHEASKQTRRTRTWVISPGESGEEGTTIPPRLLFDRSYDDPNPGSPMMWRTRNGRLALAKVKGSSGDDGIHILLKGRGAKSEGGIPFLDLIEINTKKTERLWEGEEDEFYEYVVCLMCDQHNRGEYLFVNQLEIITCKESLTEITQCSIVSWPEKKTRVVANFQHSHPKLKAIRKLTIKCQRNDGRRLNADLYLPKNDSSEDKPKPLPCLIWIYPEGVIEDDNELIIAHPTPAVDWLESPQTWVAMGFAVLLYPTIPIYGTRHQSPSNSFVEQLYASLDATVNEVVREGWVDGDKIAIAGHSYGAFAVANLMASEKSNTMFRCGIALSGAYNRTLTPFGFQNERRKLWHARDTYFNISPFIWADQIMRPILLIHGKEDGNAKTPPMQSERFYEGLEKLGKTTKLVMLPNEGHTYIARDSIMHVHWEIAEWLRKYCLMVE
ncbi:OLC1v1004434C1 [Oldenlandia corymbosa var. corymbosa]|uniref:OLC1v1004434C1 n=1 Tax=Oldenlandia corymbosa var. corymbosa TaxID=529605 RepID=A0AAV1DCZ1_OLDCO|nr:OLC1v1004434C1 [Oldenlandia corymbosa var. corymbosa]